MLNMTRRALFALSLLTISTASAQEMKPIRIGFQTGEINVILSYALGAGLFKAGGLNVKVMQFPPVRRCFLH